MTAGLAIGSTDPYVVACNVPPNKMDRTDATRLGMIFMGVDLRLLKCEDSRV